MMGNILVDLFEYNGMLIQAGIKDKPELEIKNLEESINKKKLEFTG